MQSNSYRELQIKAHKRLKADGKLTYGARRDLLNLSTINPNLTTIEEGIFHTLIEIDCADLVKHKWEKYCGEYFVYLPSSLLNLARNYINYSQSDYKHIKEATNSINSFTDFVVYYHSNPSFHSIILEDDLPLTPAMISEARFSLASMNDAVLAVYQKGTPLRYDVEDDWEADPFTSCAVDWAVKATDLTPKEFWTWYIDVAFPQAIAEAPKYLNKAES